MHLTKKHLSLIITFVIITSFISIIPNTEQIKADMGGPRSIYGYILHASNDTAVPDGTNVHLIDVNTSYMDNTTTGSGTGLYFFTVDVGVDPYDLMVINCSWYNSSGDIWEHGAGACNITPAPEPADIVNFSLTTESLSMNINDSTWSAGSLSVGNENNTNATDDSYFNISNQGNIRITILVSGENITFNGDIWNLTSTTDEDNFTVRYQKLGGSLTNIKVTNETFREHMYPNNGTNWWFYKTDPYTDWQQFGLNITMPTAATATPSTTTSVNITFWAISLD